MARKPSEQKPVFPVFPVAVILVALAAGVLWWMRRPAPVDNTPRPTPTATAKAARPAAMSYTIFVPNDDAYLTRKTITEKNPFPGNNPTWSQKAGRTLELLCKRLTILPRATKVLNSPQKDDKGVVTINMSDEFMTLNGAHETTVGLVLDAISSTLGAVDSPDGKPAKVRVLVEGRPITTLSEYDLSGVWTSSQPADKISSRIEALT